MNQIGSVMNKPFEHYFVMSSYFEYCIRYIFFFLLPLVIIICFNACQSTTKKSFSIKYTPPLTSQASQTCLAGATRIDITPPPGLPLAGFSAISGYAKGVRTHLLARVIYLKPKVGQPVALVQCDLLAGSRILHHAIANKISQSTDIDASGLVLSGTHTHSAPGNFFDSHFYNQFASNAAGFDSSFFTFLCNQISTAIIHAYQNRKPAKLSSGTIKITNATRNRSLNAYHNNSQFNQQSKLNVFEAVNPYLHMIRIDCMDPTGHYTPLAAFSTFSIHPNVNPKNLDYLYNGDVFAYMSRELEYDIQRHYHTAWQPVHAAVNYTHGDNNANLPDHENFLSLKELGTMIGKKAFALFVSLEKSLSPDCFIQYRSTEMDWLNAAPINSHSICPRPIVGCACLAGAKDKSSLLYYIPPFRPGYPRLLFTGACQGPKRVAFGPLQYLVIPKESFPHNLFLQVIQINDMLFIPLPFEICYEIGMRMAAFVEATAKQAGLKMINHVIPISCSNGYWGYVTTPEEYELQYYEGGHTLYGPGTGQYLSECIEKLIHTLVASGSGGNLYPEWQFNVWERTFYPEIKQPLKKRSIYKEPLFKSAHDKNQEESYFYFQWIDVPPCLIDFHHPLVSIEFSGNKKDWSSLMINGIPVDDQSYNIGIIHLSDQTSTQMGLYEARWYQPNRNPKHYYRFKIMPRESLPVFFSPVF